MASALKRPHDHEDTDDEDRLAAKLFSSGILQKKDNDVTSSDSEDEVQAETTSRAVWHDEDEEDDEEIVVPNTKKNVLLRRANDTEVVSKKEFSERLRQTFKKSTKGGQPKWAIQQPQEVGSDSDEEVNSIVHDVTRSVSKYLGKSKKLSYTTINTRTLQNLAIGHGDSKTVNVVKFHRSKPVIIAAGESGLIRLFQVDSEVKKSHFLQSAQLQKFPITSCDLLYGGMRLLLGSRSQTYFMTYDMEVNKLSEQRLPKNIPRQNCGKFAVSADGRRLALVGFRGQIYVLDTATLDHICTFSTSGEVASVQFNPLGNDEIWAVSEKGEVLIWSISSRSQTSFYNEGAVHGTAIGISPDGRSVAIGENTGFVNVYDIDSIRHNDEKKPLFSIANIVTPVDSLCFNHDRQLLAIASSAKRNEIRFVHNASGTVYQNFPAKLEPFPHVHSLDFSPHSRYAAFGLENGGIRVEQLESYSQY